MIIHTRFGFKEVCTFNQHKKMKKTVKNHNKIKHNNTSI